jgi:hypothetical protein
LELRIQGNLVLLHFESTPAYRILDDEMFRNDDMIWLELAKKSSLLVKLILKARTNTEAMERPHWIQNYNIEAGNYKP